MSPVETSLEQRALVAHLFRRAGFGTDAQTVSGWANKGYEAAVTDLLNPTPKGKLLFETLHLVRNTVAAPSGNLGDAQEVWARAMALSPAPLLERMTLFLSNHFATAYSPGNNVDAIALMNQQTTIRKLALGSFAELTHKMLDDLAFACFLNNDQNKKDAPNENLARELMELFLLGRNGGYTEQDVRESARALTGYTLKSLVPGTSRPRLVYDAKLHDDTPKTILGSTQRFTPHSLVDFLLKQPTASQFIARKLVTAFVGVPDTALTDTIAGGLRQNWNLGIAMRTLFLSPQFKAPTARHTVVKMPAEYMTGIVRTLKRDEYRETANRMATAGQALYKPPSVAGWPTGQRLLGSGAMLARYNAAARLAYAHTSDPRNKAPKFGADPTLWMGALGLTEISDATSAAVTAYLKDTEKQTTQVRTAGVITLLASSPEYQLA